MGWEDKLCAAMALGHFSTVDLRGVPRPQMVTIDQLIRVAQSQYEGLTTQPWQEVQRHLGSLGPLGCQTLSVRADQRAIYLVIGRAAPDGLLEIEEARRYSVAMDGWLDALADILPDVK